MSVLQPFRHAVAQLVGNGCSTPTFTHLPDDMAHLPCYVVGRPSASEFLDTKGVLTLTLDVMALGRRISDEDAQSELDALADQLLTLLGGTRSVRFGEGQHLRCTSITPTTVSVAGLDYPAYFATVATEALSC